MDVEVGEGCRTIQALKEAIVVALPQLCVEGFDVSVGGRALDDDEGVVSLQQDVSLDVSANSRGLSVLALREAGREVSEAGLFDAAFQGDVSNSRALWPLAKKLCLEEVVRAADVPFARFLALIGEGTKNDENGMVILPPVTTTSDGNPCTRENLTAHCFPHLG